MPRKPSPQRSAEYEGDWQFALVFSAFLDSLSRELTAPVGESRPDGTIASRLAPNTYISLADTLAAARASAESRGRHLSHTSVRMALQDLIEMSRDLNTEQLSQADARLAARGLPTVSAMRLKVWRTIPKVLKRGQIRNDLEYYLLVERLNDVDSHELVPEDRLRLETMIETYGQSKQRKGPPAA